MERCHLYLPLVDSSGAPYEYAEITLTDPSTDRPIDEPVYLEPYGGAPQRWPLLIDPAVVNVWTDRPLQVTLQASLPGGATFTRAGVDIAPAPSAVMRTHAPLHLGSTDGLDGLAVLAVSPGGTANWQLLDGLLTHRHRGDAPSSTSIGTTDYDDIYPQQTWLGVRAGGIQGERASMLGSAGLPNGVDATLIGRATSSDQAVAIGASSSASTDTVAVGPGTITGKANQVALGSGASATAGAAGAVVAGAATTAVALDSIRLKDSLRLTDGTAGPVVIGKGTLPNLSWLPSQNYVALLNALTASGNFAAPADSAVMAGPVSALGFFGNAAGTGQPMLTTNTIPAAAPGRSALLSLSAALDRLGLVKIMDSAVDDELNDWTKTSAHSANMVLETGDTDGSKAGDLSRAKRNATGLGTFTYRMTTDIRDFTFRAFVLLPAPNPPTHEAEITAFVSPDNVTWTPVPLAWQPLQATAADWHQTWAANGRAVPAGMRYVQFRIDLNAQAGTPQIGRVIVRQWPIRNLALNPSMTVDLSNTQLFGASATSLVRSRVTSEYASGGSSIQHVANVANDLGGTAWTIEPVTAGNRVQVSVRIKLAPGTVMNRGLIVWRTEDMVTTLDFKELLPLGVPDSNGWLLVSGSTVVPEGFVCARVGLSFRCTTPGGIWYADSMMVEQSETLHTYTDGTMAGSSWEGVPHASVSRHP
ncbi:hypothetical protein E6R60_26215 [Streptomyces sp. A0642]|uniref:hypothetical protein n=1 Tax=Streptomyces sp. A0642 TaxID=2563100 RepID=UPI0010A28302|nr:hypothetical protein [Streptomyces sp. A0642]THA72432.1 hypothetical protein E6R60_26215 [Streptomyces sp. A0642]